MDTLDSLGSPIANKMLDLPSFMPDYLAHFGLRSDPFAVADFYRGAARQSFIDNLHHQVLFGAGLLVVGAAEGVGKTRLCAQLQASFDDVPASVCSISLQGGVTLQSFVAELALMLGISSLAAVPLGRALSELRRYLQARREDGSLSVLLIDDAHHLDDQSLATLVGLLQGQADLDRSVCVVLFAEPNFLGRLAVTDIGDLLLHDILLEAFDIDDLRAYLQWRFAQVGDESPLPYKDADLERWLRESAGNLNRIHLLAQQWLLEFVSSKSDVNAGVDVNGGLGRAPVQVAEPGLQKLRQLPLLHVGAIALLSGVLLLAYIFQEGGESASDSSTLAGRTNSPASLELDLPDNSSAGGVAERAGKPAKLLPVATESMVVALDTAGERASVSFTPAQTVSEPVLVEDKNTAEALPVEPSVSPREFIEVEVPLVVEVMKEPEVVQVANATSVPSFSADEEKLLAFKKRQYVLQVMAASSRVSVEGFVSKQPNRKKLYVYSSVRQGVHWYAAVAGPYDSIEAARAAVARLPSGQRKAGPWPRSVADVQAKIRENNNI